MNPLIRQPNQPIDYAAITPAHIAEAEAHYKQQVGELRKHILSSQPTDKTARVWSFDKLMDTPDQLTSPIYLLKDTHPDEDIRKACGECVERLLQFENEISLDEELYEALKDFSEQQITLTSIEARFVQKRMEGYLRNGFKLDKAGRDKLKQLDDDINGKELQFSKNLAESNDFLMFTESDLDGLPADFIKDRLTEDGKCKITTQMPDYFPVIRYAKKEHVRKELYYMYVNRGRELNVPLLDEILKLRMERSKLLGFSNYAVYNLAGVMAEKPANVWNFLEELAKKVRPKAEADYKAMCDALKIESILPWDKFFVSARYKDAEFQLDDEQVKPYFPLQAVLDGLFQLAQTLYGIEIKPMPNPSVWQEDVSAWQVEEGGKEIARFYLDLFPRENKYGHAACFGIQRGCDLGRDYRQPEAALVCNFPKPTDSKPSLLTHSNVETMFHEFGHLMHQLLTRSPLSYFAGTCVDRDFVEMPSQFFEGWTWEKAFLQSFAKHYQTGEAIPESLVDKMLAVKNLNSGIHIQQQIFYATIDMTYHDGFMPDGPQDSTVLVTELQKKLTLFPAAPDTAFQAGFEHLMGYAAGYYGYLWSRVFAADMYDTFKQNGIYDQATGKRFREMVLEVGGGVPPQRILKRFLGRDPKLDPFLADIGVA